MKSSLSRVQGRKKKDFKNQNRTLFIASKSQELFNTEMIADGRYRAYRLLRVPINYQESSVL